MCNIAVLERGGGGGGGGEMQPLQFSLAARIQINVQNIMNIVCANLMILSNSCSQDSTLAYKLKMKKKRNFWSQAHPKSSPRRRTTTADRVTVSTSLVFWKGKI